MYCIHCVCISVSVNVCYSPSIRSFLLSLHLYVILHWQLLSLSSSLILFSLPSILYNVYLPSSLPSSPLLLYISFSPFHLPSSLLPFSPLILFLSSPFTYFLPLLLSFNPFFLSHPIEKLIFLDIIIEDDKGEETSDPPLPYQLSQDAVVMEMTVKDILVHMCMIINGCMNPNPILPLVRIPIPFFPWLVYMCTGTGSSLGQK